ncbi:hypothetical protein RhiirA1_193837 [Rhizophagus irregularis]|uniref:Uncharacterized protein n=1 Tax=Rhizophagus irregularis TaxID=588596 RepID=A0A2N0SFZ3_9GLOM|nr:hypothetical protein RhiirA1_193837 [Rhizophagus irregularis]
MQGFALKWFICINYFTAKKLICRFVYFRFHYHNFLVLVNLLIFLVPLIPLPSNNSSFSFGIMH